MARPATTKSPFSETQPRSQVIGDDANPQRHLTLQPGSVVDHRFRIIRELGRGGMATIYEVVDVLRSTQHALKVAHHAPGAWAALNREALVLSRLQHANVVNVCSLALRAEDSLFYTKNSVVNNGDDGCEQTIRYIVLELLPGQTLRDYLHSHGPLRLERMRPFIWSLIDQVTAALIYLHDRNVLHLDINPANLIFHAADKRVVVIDFGLAQSLGGIGNRAYVTPGYGSPEQLFGYGLDQRADVFGLAATLYEAFTGRPPYDRATIQAGAQAVLGQLPPHWPAALSPELGQILQRALAPQRESRPKNIATIRAELAKVVCLSTTTPTGKSARRTTRPSYFRHRRRGASLPEGKEHG